MKDNDQKRAWEILKDFRTEINELDDELMQLIGKRFDIMRKVAVVKDKYELPSFLYDRVIQVRDNAIELGKKYNVNPNFTYGLYTSMIMHSCILEDEEMEKMNSDIKDK